VSRQDALPDIHENFFMRFERGRDVRLRKEYWSTSVKNKIPYFGIKICRFPDVVLFFFFFVSDLWFLLHDGVSRRIAE